MSVPVPESYEALRVTGSSGLLRLMAVPLAVARRAGPGQPLAAPSQAGPGTATGTGSAAQYQCQWQALGSPSPAGAPARGPTPRYSTTCNSYVSESDFKFKSELLLVPAVHWQWPGI